MNATTAKAKVTRIINSGDATVKQSDAWFCANGRKWGHSDVDILEHLEQYRAKRVTVTVPTASEPVVTERQGSAVRSRRPAGRVRTTTASPRALRRRRVHAKTGEYVLVHAYPGAEVKVIRHGAR